MDIAGDGTMSAWQAKKEKLSDISTKACTAATEIVAAHKHLNNKPGIPIQARIGLHAGDFILNFVRVGDRYFYKGTGNTLHIASRIEQLNKKLEPQILGSELVIRNIEQLSLKQHGLFTIRGLRKELEIMETQRNQPTK